MQGAEDELKHAVAFVRPVSVAFEVVSGFRLYSKGVYTSNSCGSTPMVSINTFWPCKKFYIFSLLVAW